MAQDWCPYCGEGQFYCTTDNLDNEVWVCSECDIVLTECEHCEMTGVIEIEENGETIDIDCPYCGGLGLSE